MASMEAPRRRLDREVTPGRCGNLDYCSIGMQRVLVKVALSQPFVCPECGSPLRPPGQLRKAARLSLLLPALRMAVLLAAMGASGAAGYVAGRMQPAVSKAVHTAGTGLEAVESAVGLAVPSPAVAANAVPTARAAAPVFVADRPYPLRAAPVDAAKPPGRLMREARFGQVTVDCALAAVLRHPACQVTDIRGADPVSAAAVLWLQGLSVQYAPSVRGGASVSLDHRWRVIFEDYSGTARRGMAQP